MDGELHPIGTIETADGDAVARGAIRPLRRPVSRKRRVFWFGLVATLLALVLGGLYGFNWYRNKMIANYFATFKPPPAQISAVTAEAATVPRSAAGIGSLAAVHQVTISPEVGGRVTKIFFTAGGSVKAGDPLIQLNDEPERGDLANFQAQAHWAEITLARNSHLAQRQFASQETVDQNQTQAEQMKAQIAKTEAIIAQKLVRAPFGGKLGVRQVEVGQFLNAGAPIVTLTDLSHLYINFTLPSQQLSLIKLGQKVEVTADAFPGRVFTAEIATIEPQIRAETRTITVQATMANPDEALMPGMFVNAAVVLPPQPNQVIVPETAVDYTLYGDSVYTIREEGQDSGGKPVLKAHRTPVTTGARWEGKVAILSGLNPGDRIVGAGQVKLQDGAQVIVTGNPPPQPPANPTSH
ncbi:MAG TPA: efflux RND transporter periplasmic adaptor subunit [Stellaceae bacterium]|jgi:multidrug efflux system membrane fusion protein|nr:efflux RND transporter periplasmic adaptor subunit [Stellaceae bacterium]